VLGIFVIGYLILSIGIGLWAARRVHNAEDFMLAGRSLPLSLATFTVFATWFGSETLLGASSTFAEEGLIGVIEDPFGASLCLLLVGLFFARYFYRLRLLTLSDFFRDRFGKNAEWVSAICMATSFFAWVAGQLVALGVVIHAIFGIEISKGIFIATGVVAVYTIAGGMWSVAVTDFVQTIFIIIGIVIVSIYITPVDFHWQGLVLPKDFFVFAPKSKSLLEWSNYFCAWITLGLGSIPSQDIFQRVMSSKDENVAARSAILAGIMYLVIGMLPLYLAFMAKFVWHVQVEDNQSLLTTLVIEHMPIVVQIMFFGALISAVLSTASGAILAPASVISENIIKPIFQITDSKKLLVVERIAVVFVTLLSMFLAMGNTNIYEMVGEASALGLVSLFVPMMMAIYWNKRSEFASILSMVGGMGAYLYFSYIYLAAFPPLLVGLITSLLGYVIPSLWIKKP